MTSRNRSRSWLALPVAGAAGALDAGVALRRLMRRAAPPFNGHLSAAGLRAPVEIIRDTWGVPHIYAENAHDLFLLRVSPTPRIACSRWISTGGWVSATCRK